MATTKELEAKIAQLEATIEANKPAPKTMSIKVSEKTGCIIIGGLTGRYPISLYRSTLQLLFSPENAGTVLTFLEVNDQLITDTMLAAGKTDR